MYIECVYLYHIYMMYDVYIYIYVYIIYVCIYTQTYIYIYMKFHSFEYM